MADNAVHIPPIRTNLKDPNGTDQTAKEWYLYWRQQGDRINVFNRMIGFGGHGDRPLDPPEGSIYFEEDRGGVLYQMQGGNWHYVAGAMWGTVIAADQRPKDLGVNDTGFLFLSKDSTSVRWNGGSWDALDRILDLGPAPQFSQLVAKANGLGAFGILCYAPDTVAESFDLEFTGGTWTARNATVAMIQKNAGRLQFFGSAGNPVGGTATLTMRGSMDLATGNWRLGDSTAAAYAVDSAGDVNATGVFRVGGTQVVGPRLGAVAAPSIATATITKSSGLTYTVNEKDMLTDIKNAVNALNTDVLNLQTAISDICARLQTHGLTA